MLKRLTISRFKSIYEETLEFGKVNLFIGPNGSGKSNILEAIGILASILSRGLEPSELDLKGIRISLPHIFKSAFKGHELPKTFRIEAHFENGRYECSIRASASSSYLEFFTEALYDGEEQVFGRSMHGIRFHGKAARLPKLEKSAVPSSRSVWSIISPLVDISEKLRTELNEFSRFAIYSPQTAIMRGLAVDNRVVEPLGLTGSGLASAFHQAISQERNKDLHSILKIIWEPGWADNIMIGQFDPNVVPSHVKSEGILLYIRDKYMKTGRNTLSAFDSSEGTLYLIFVATLLAHRETPSVFSLDNVDGTLNPTLVRKLTDHLVRVCTQTGLGSQPRQVFMTSHHPSSLDSFDIFDPDQCIFICNRNKEQTGVIGATFFRGLKPPSNETRETWAVKHGSKNISELLLANRIKDAL